MDTVEQLGLNTSIESSQWLEVSPEQIQHTQESIWRASQASRAALRNQKQQWKLILFINFLLNDATTQRTMPYIQQFMIDLNIVYVEQFVRCILPYYQSKADECSLTSLYDFDYHTSDYQSYILTITEQALIQLKKEHVVSWYNAWYSQTICDKIAGAMHDFSQACQSHYVSKIDSWS